MNEIEVKNRIKEVLNQKNTTVNAISTDGTIQVRLSRQINGETALSYSTISYILECFPDLSAEWLLRGTGEMFVAEETEAEVVHDGEVPVIPVDLFRQPYTDIVKYIHDNSHAVEYGSIDDQLPEYDYVCRAINDAMNPYFAKGDRIALRRVTKDTIIENEVYLIDTDSGGFLRRVVLDGDVLVCKASHPAYKTIRVPLSEVKNLMIVVIVLRCSFTPSPITLDDLHKRDETIERLNDKNDEMFHELIKYGGRIDEALAIARNAQEQSKGAAENVIFAAAK